MTIAHWTNDPTPTIATEVPAKVVKKKPGRKSNAERAELRAEAVRRDRIAQVEAKRAPRIQPDTRVTLAITLVIGAVALLTSFTVSYATIAEVADWMKLPMPGLAYIVPGFIELLTVFSSLDYLLSRSRGKSGRGAFWTMILFSAIAVLGNAAHSYQKWGPHIPWNGWVGVVLSGLAPLVVVLVTKRVSALVFAEPEAIDA